MRNGTPKMAKTPALMVNEMGTMAAPDRDLPKNQRTNTTPGNMNKNKVLKKTTRGNDAKSDLRKPMKIKANALSATIEISSIRWC
jgi:hypothetical protein